MFNFVKWVLGATGDNGSNHQGSVDSNVEVGSCHNPAESSGLNEVLNGSKEEVVVEENELVNPLSQLLQLHTLYGRKRFNVKYTGRYSNRVFRGDLVTIYDKLLGLQIAVERHTEESYVHGYKVMYKRIVSVNSLEISESVPLEKFDNIISHFSNIDHKRNLKIRGYLEERRLRNEREAILILQTNYGV